MKYTYTLYSHIHGISLKMSIFSINSQLFIFYQIGEYAELGDVKAVELDKDEAEFLRVCESRVKDNGGKLKVVDVNKKESMLEAENEMGFLGLACWSGIN